MNSSPMVIYKICSINIINFEISQNIARFSFMHNFCLTSRLGLNVKYDKKKYTLLNKLPI